LHPDIDVRISATIDMLNLERSSVDLAIRYCKPEVVPEGAVRLFGEEVLPVCSPDLLRRGPSIKQPQDLLQHVLLHFDFPGADKMVMDWGTWLTALGLKDAKAAGALHFSQYEQLVQAAIGGQGIALGRQPLVNELLKTGALVTPLNKAVVGTRGYFIIESALAQRKPHVQQFIAWLREEVNRDIGTAARD
jgi:DNA-binding transcriptional LysR family regulator